MAMIIKGMKRRALNRLEAVATVLEQARDELNRAASAEVVKGELVETADGVAIKLDLAAEDLLHAVEALSGP